MQNSGTRREQDSLLTSNVSNQLQEKVVVIELFLFALGHSDVVVETDLETDVCFLFLVASSITVWV